MMVLRDHDGTPSSILGVGRDITESRQAEEKLRESEERFRALSENAPDIIYTMNLLGAITYVNPSWKRILGQPPRWSLVLEFLPRVEVECPTLQPLTVNLAEYDALVATTEVGA